MLDVGSVLPNSFFQTFMFHLFNGYGYAILHPEVRCRWRWNESRSSKVKNELVHLLGKLRFAVVATEQASSVSSRKLSPAMATTQRFALVCHLLN